MKIRLNGEESEVKDGLTLQELVEALGLAAGRLACEVNLEIVRRDDYPKHVLQEGDRLEIVQMMGGG